MLASDEVTNLGSIGGELIDFTLVVEHGYTLGFDKWIGLGSSGGWFNSSTEINLRV